MEVISMQSVLTGSFVYIDGIFKKTDIAICEGVIAEIGSSLSFFDAKNVIDCSGLYIVPGFADVHVHLRQPGFSYKETIKSGTLAAARGGYTSLCLMPNLNPVPDSISNIKLEMDIIETDALVKCYPYASITKGRMGKGNIVDFGTLKDIAIAFSDDGTGVNDEYSLSQAMEAASRENVLIAAHCEDQDLVNGGYIHDGFYSKSHNHKGISSESEWIPLERDLLFAEKHGCHYHICHVSTKESVSIIRQAKKRGVNVTAETAPHYLVLCDEDLEENGCFKMNPPLRSREDKEALLEGLIDGTIDVIATDHAPHSIQEKTKGLKDSAFGITGLETAFPVLYTRLVKTGLLSLEKLIFLMSIAPRKVFSLPLSNMRGLEKGQPADIAVLDINSEYTISTENFFSKGKSTPFEGWKVFGENVLTLVDGQAVYTKKKQ